MDGKKINTSNPFFLKSTLVRGFKLPAAISPEDAIMGMDFVPDDGNIILCSYVKTGSTFLQYIIWLILHPEDELPNLQEMQRLVPYHPGIEMPSSKHMFSRRFYRSHYPYDLIKINKKAKYIYIYRNPCDVMSSYYNYFSHIFQDESESIKQFFDCFVKGQVNYGSYFDHVLSFYRHKTEPHVLMISYEKLLEDKRSQILKIAQFLGPEYHKRLLENNVQLQKILKQTEFNHMKENVNTTLTEIRGIPEIEVKMFRKGIVGDGKMFLTLVQVKCVEKKIQEKFEGTSILSEWLTFLRK